MKVCKSTVVTHFVISRSLFLHLQKCIFAETSARTYQATRCFNLKDSRVW